MASGTLLSDIQCWIHKVHILLIQLFPQQLYRLAEALEVYHLALPEELDHIVHIRIVGKPKNIIVGDPGFLLCQGVP